jgi:carboxypeptidase D
MRRVINSLQLYVMPMFNADGYENRRRTNANGVDLNRNFPNRWTSDSDTDAGRQPETNAFRAFTSQHTFAASLMMHGGALCVNYPYDSCDTRNQQCGRGMYSATSRDREVVNAALLYSQLNPPMYRSTFFPDGIVNGAQWYVIYGSLQDFMFDYR